MPQIVLFSLTVLKQQTSLKKGRNKQKTYNCVRVCAGENYIHLNVWTNIEQHIHARTHKDKQSDWI